MRKLIFAIAISLAAAMVHAQEAPHVTKLLPRLVTAQYGGNIGVISIGPGWEYGRHDCMQTHVLLGYLPKEVMFDNYFCLTIRQNYTPWRLATSPDVKIAPAVFGFAANTLFSGEFWYREPDENYYNVSTKLRFHLSMGGRFDYHFPNPASSVSGKLRHRRLSLYYEVSTYDLALLSYVRGSSIHFHDIFCLAIGLQYRFF